MGSSYSWDFFLAAFLFKSPQFQDSVFLDRIVCVRGVFSGMVVSVGGMSHGECLWRHLLFKHREHIMSFYDWSGAKLYDRRRWRDYVKCHTAREDTERDVDCLAVFTWELWVGLQSFLLWGKLCLSLLWDRHGVLKDKSTNKQKNRLTSVLGIELYAFICMIMYHHMVFSAC